MDQEAKKIKQEKPPILCYITHSLPSALLSRKGLYPRVLSKQVNQHAAVGLSKYE